MLHTGLLPSVSEKSVFGCVPPVKNRGKQMIRAGSFPSAQPFPGSGGPPGP